ncbi:hypothetical protein D6C85_02835 [Aureobasidium pullulans]|uniref:Uncharacterized protein n=1 Tax=Aureobasidium pullulans TaxID=5580 RepID=A0A4S9X936_AURPU|nr:hypothetical protein D6C85_02835 [Aureobasidium pullulans]
MGTRNLTIVYYKGKYRICQYGQWDGDSQGLTIYNFLLVPTNITKLEKVLDAGDSLIHTLTDEECKAWGEEMFAAQMAWNQRPRDPDTWELFQVSPISLSRDTGANILNLLVQATEQEPVKVKFWDMKFITDTLCCEWTWVVDLDKKVLEAYTSWEFAELFGNEELPGLVKRYEFAKLPESRKAMLEDFEVGRKEE